MFMMVSNFRCENLIIKKMLSFAKLLDDRRCKDLKRFISKLHFLSTIRTICGAIISTSLIIAGSWPYIQRKGTYVLSFIHLCGSLATGCNAFISIYRLSFQTNKINPEQEEIKKKRLLSQAAADDHYNCVASRHSVVSEERPAINPLTKRMMPADYFTRMWITRRAEKEKEAAGGVVSITESPAIPISRYEQSYICHDPEALAALGDIAENEEVDDEVDAANNNKTIDYDTIICIDETLTTTALTETEHQNQIIDNV
jgi:hypothetical protein